MSHVVLQSDVGTDNNNDVSAALPSDVVAGNDIVIVALTVSNKDDGPPDASSLLMTGTATFGPTEVAIAKDTIIEANGHLDAAIYRCPILTSGSAQATFAHSENPRQGYVSMSEVTNMGATVAEATAFIVDQDSNLAPALPDMTSEGDAIFFGGISMAAGPLTALTKGADYTEIGNVTVIGGPAADFAAASQYRVVEGATTDGPDWTDTEPNVGHLAVGAVWPDKHVNLSVDNARHRQTADNVNTQLPLEGEGKTRLYVSRGDRVSFVDRGDRMILVPPSKREDG